MNTTENYFDLLPKEVVSHIAHYCPKKIFMLVSKKFYLCASIALKQEWNSLKKDEKGSDLSQKMAKIEKHEAGKGSFWLLRTFCTDLYSEEQIEKINVCQMHSEMIKAWEADRDYNLCRCWSRVANQLDIEDPPVDAKDIRAWMSAENNRERMHQIQELNLSLLGLTHLPTEILFEGLKVLNLRGNKLKELPSEIGKLVNLKTLIVLGNKLKELPSEIGKLLKLEKLFVSNNKLKKLPPEIGKLLLLKELHINDNPLLELPIELGNLTGLEILKAGSNRCRRIPPEIGKLLGLRQLSLFSSELTELPNEIGNLLLLKELDVRYNRLTELPPEIAGMATKLDLMIDENPLLLIPKCILNKFKRNQDIIDFLDSKNQPYSLIKEIVLLIKKNSENILNDKFEEKQALGNLVDQLETSEKEFIHYHIWKQAWNKEDGDLYWGEDHRFDNMRLFVSVLGRLINQAREEKCEYFKSAFQI